MAIKRDKWLRIIEFLIIGVLLGVIEDIIAILLATNSSFSWRIVFIAFFVALPFAFFSELVVDHPKFWDFFKKAENNNTNQKNI